VMTLGGTAALGSHKAHRLAAAEVEPDRLG
jgi:hypothetical protein